MRMLLILAISATLIGPLSAQRPSARQPLRAPRSIESVRRATVKIEAVGREGAVTGSGFVVSADGVIATAAHVIRGVTSAKIRMASGEAYDVQGAITADASRDFALLRIAGFGLPTVEFGNSDSVHVGQRLLSFGAPLGLEATVSDGLLSSLRLVDDVRLMQISIPVSPGSSGGPVTTEDGLVVGIVVSGIRGGGAENLNFALPINYVRGELALAPNRTPTPLAHAPDGGAALPSQPSAGAPNTVNDSLQPDWAVLDGVTLYSEDNDHTRTISTLTQYSKTVDVTGTPALERYQRRVWNQGFRDLSRYEERTVLSTDGDYRQFSEFADLNQAVAGSSYEVSLERGDWRLTSGGALKGSAKLPRGVLPSTLLGAVVGALPESLPRSLHVWVVEWDTAFVARAVAARLDFGERGSLQVPVAASGESCGPTTRVTRRKLPIVWVTVTVEAQRSVRPVIASPPHLFVDPSDIKCVAAPHATWR